MGPPTRTIEYFKNFTRIVCARVDEAFPVLILLDGSHVLTYSFRIVREK